jgi:hypothetical protein
VRGKKAMHMWTPKNMHTSTNTHMCAHVCACKHT